MSSREPSYFSRQVTDARRFYFPSRAKETLAVEAGGREECDRTYEVERENFPRHVIEFISRGTARIQLGRERWNLPAGSVYIYNRDLPHRLGALTDDGMTKYFVILRGANVRRVLAAHGLHAGRVIQVSDPGRLTEIFEDLVQLGCTGRRNRRTLNRAALRYLLFKIESLTLSRERWVSGSYSAYRKCLRAMEAHCLEFTSVADVAAACQLSPAYVCRLFARFGDSPPYRVLHRLRMDYAARVLRTTERSAKSLSEELGFNDAAAFSRAFKRSFGVAPARYRSPDQLA